MSEAVFPVLGAAVVLTIVLPSFALLARLGLWLFERDALGGPLHGSNRRYVLLLGSSFLPLAWFISAGLHQAESGRSALSCLLDHDQAALCFEPAIFALLLGVGAAGGWLRTLRCSERFEPSTSAAAERALARIERLLTERVMLAGLRGRVAVTDRASFALGTSGFARPRVLIGIHFAAQLTDEMLVSALAHEQEHVRSLDPLRYLLLELSLVVNPFGAFLLAPHARRWKAAHEAHCDREAVLNGAAALPLADAIVRAARPLPSTMAGLGAGDTALVRLRVDMLLAFAERAPVRCCSEHRPGMPVALALLLLALLLPHQTGTHALDALHTGTEQAVTYLWR